MKPKHKNQLVKLQDNLLKDIFDFLKDKTRFGEWGKSNIKESLKGIRDLRDAKVPLLEVYQDSLKFTIVDLKINDYPTHIVIVFLGITDAGSKQLISDNELTLEKQCEIVDILRSLKK